MKLREIDSKGKLTPNLVECPLVLVVRLDARVSAIFVVGQIMNGAKTTRQLTSQ
jgi:hypothetical protein